MSQCKTVSTRGIIVDWNVNFYDGKEVDVRNADLDELCQPSKIRGKAVFGQGDTFDEYKFFCDKLGGQLPTFVNKRDFKAQYRDIERRFENNFGSKVSCKLDNDLFIWTGLAKDVSSTDLVFLDLYTQEPITWEPNLWPGPAAKEVACSMIRGKDFLAREKCDSKLPCGICYFSPFRKLVLKGLCFNELKTNLDFDTEYYVHGILNGRVHFR